MKDHDLEEELDKFDADLKKIHELGGTYDNVLVLFMEFVVVV